jgi:molybdenum cofactor guanylyltransferase
VNLSAVILAGGQSRRMGRDKARLEVDGQSLLARAVGKARELGVAEVFISGRPGEDYSALKCPVMFDLEPGCGPLGGIERALHAATAPLVLVLAVDLPAMTAAFLARLVAQCDALTGAVPQLDGQLEPLSAIYPRRCHAIAAHCLSHARRAARDFAEACRAEHAVRPYVVRTDDAQCFVNWNCPADVCAPATGMADCVRPLDRGFQI